MNLAESSLKLFAANLLSAGLQFLGIVYFARVLDPATMGMFFLFQALLGMLAIPADFGLRGAVEKRISEGKSKEAFLASALILKFLPIVVIIFGIFVLQAPINNYVGTDIAVLLAIGIVLQEAARLAVVVLQGELRVGETAVLKVVREATWVGVGATLVSLGYGTVALVYGLLAGFGLMLLWGWYKVSITPRNPSRKHAQSLFNFGKYNLVSSLGGYFYNWMDVAIIGLFLTQAHVGAYEIAWRIASLVILLSRSISTVIFPQVSQWSADNAQDKIESLIPQVLTPSLILVIPAFFGTLLLSKEILRYVFGAEYTIAALALIILMFDQVTEAGQVVLGRSLQAVNRPDLAARATVVGVTLNLILNLSLIPMFGIAGAATATMIASLISGLILHTFYLSRIIDIWIPYREIASCGLAAVTMVLILRTVVSISSINSLMSLGFAVILGAVVYGSTLLLIPNTRRKMINHSREILGGEIT